MISVEKPGSPAEILEHHGIKGMHWGVRKAVDTAIGTKTAGRKPSSGSKVSSIKGKAKRAGRAASRTASDVGFVLNSKSDVTTNKIVNKATDRLIRDLPRIKAKHGEYAKLSNRTRHPFHPAARAYRKDVSDTYLRHLERSANEITSSTGRFQYTLSEHGKPNTSKYLWNVSVREVAHAANGATTFTVQPIFDSEAYIVDVKPIDTTMAQIADRGLNFLIHMDIIET